MDNNLRLTKEFKHIFIGPESVKGYFVNLYPYSTFITLADNNFKSIRSYNRLLLSPFFYRIFSDYSHILICQLDVCLLRKLKIDHLLSYDFVGAPCTFGIGQNLYVGNGGFSLRRISAFRQTLEAGFNIVKIKFKDCRNLNQYIRFMLNKVSLHRLYITLGFSNEDFIFALFLKEKLYTPPVQIALEFCQDEFIDNRLIPIAYHGWEKNLIGVSKSICLEQIGI